MPETQSRAGEGFDQVFAVLPHPQEIEGGGRALGAEH